MEFLTHIEFIGFATFELVPMISRSFQWNRFRLLSLPIDDLNVNISIGSLNTRPSRPSSIFPRHSPVGAKPRKPFFPVFVSTSTRPKNDREVLSEHGQSLR